MEGSVALEAYAGRGNVGISISDSDFRDVEVGV